MPKATVVITADNQLKKGIDPAKKSLLEIQNMVTKFDRQISKSLTLAGMAATAVASWKLITGAAKECINAYSEAEKVSMRLEAVWKNVGAASGKTAEQMDALAESLEKQTYFTSESIKEAGLLLAATESLTDEGFDRALQASMDLAAAMGEDVTSAAQTLAKAIQEPESALSRLKSIGVSFTEDEKAQIKALAEANKEYEAQDIILSKIEGKYKDVAKAINNTPVGTIDNIRDTLGDIKETLGGALLDSLSPALESIYGWLTKISQWIAQSATSTSVISALQQGSSDLTGFNVSELELALKSVNSALNSNSAEVRAHESSYIRFAELLEKEIAYRQTLGVITPTVVTGSGGNGSASATNLLADYIEKLMPKDVVSEYTAIIDQAQTYLDKITQSVPATKAELKELLGLSSDATGADIKNAIANGGYEDALKTIISTFTAKLDALIPAIVNSPTLTDLDSILASYGKQSNAYQIKQLKEEYNRIASAYEYASEEDRVYLREILASNEKQRKELEGGVEEIINGSFLDNITNSLASVFQNIGFGNEESSSAAGTVINTFTQNMGEAGEVVERLATNMAAMGPALGAIVTAIQYVVEGLAESIKPIFEEFVKYGVEPLRELGRTIGEILMPILEDIMPLVEESGRILSGIFNALGTILQPIVSFISSLLIPIIQQLTIALEIIEPILKVLGGVLLTVSTAFEWLGQGIRHIFASIANWLASLEVMGWRPFGGLAMEDPGAPGSFSDMYQKNYDEMVAGYDTGVSAVDAASTGQAIASASYRGATSVTINIYATGPFVGENGMRDFARMIREEFDALDYYGVTA